MSNSTIPKCCWRKDLEASRNLTTQQKHGFTMLLEWFENFRLRVGLSAGRKTAITFWRKQVLDAQKERTPWQLDQRADAISWYLKWLSACHLKGADHCSVPERMRQAADSVGMRRGLAKRTRQSYGSWIARYGVFAKTAKTAMQPETASRFLGWIVEEKHCSYATQKIALNALAFLFRDICGMAEVQFDVRLKKTKKRTWRAPVLAQEEVPRFLAQLECRYLLAAKLQFPEEPKNSASLGKRAP